MLAPRPVPDLMGSPGKVYMTVYLVQRIIDDEAVEEAEVLAATPEDAAFAVVGERLMRGTRRRSGNVLVCKVYWGDPPARSMTRLYRPSGSADNG